MNRRLVVAERVTSREEPCLLRHDTERNKVEPCPNCLGVPALRSHAQSPAITRTSRSKRRNCSSSFPGQHFKATRSPLVWSKTRSTTPIPPRPNSCLYQVTPIDYVTSTKHAYPVRTPSSPPATAATHTAEFRRAGSNRSQLECRCGG